MAKDVGAINLHTESDNIAEKPVYGVVDKILVKVCAKCGDKYIWAGKVKRESKYGVAYYIIVVHSKKLRRPRLGKGKRMITRKRTYCYLPISSQQLPEQ